MTRSLLLLVILLSTGLTTSAQSDWWFDSEERERDITGVDQRPMSENTINAAFRRMGFTKEEVTAHGLRSTVSTMLNESGLWHPDAIERALAHGDSNAIRGVYNRGNYWDERVKMAQWWSDYLDELRRG